MRPQTTSRKTFDNKDTRKLRKALRILIVCNVKIPSEAISYLKIHGDKKAAGYFSYLNPRRK